mgnify:CR=1 FL=1
MRTAQGLMLALSAVVLWGVSRVGAHEEGAPANAASAPAAAEAAAAEPESAPAADAGSPSDPPVAVTPGRIPDLVTKDVAWLIPARPNDGDWGVS